MKLLIMLSSPISSHYNVIRVIKT